jgi:ribosomal protein L10
MALTKKEKVQLVKEYEQLLKDSENAIVLGYEAVPVSVSVAMRKEFRQNGAMYKVVKKKVFARAAKEM